MLSHVLRIVDLLDDPSVDGSTVVEHLRTYGCGTAEIDTQRLNGDKGSTDAVRVLIPGSSGASAGGSAGTLGIIGRLGGVGARPERIGFVSDGDGAAAALATAAKLLDMHAKGDVLPGDVIVATHVCPNAPTEPHEPVPFMGSPINMQDMNSAEVDQAMDAILSIDTTKGNRFLSDRGICISPTVRQGYVLKVADDLVTTLETVTGVPARVFPVSTQDITPYGNGIYHLNSILQPATATDAPVVGVAITTVMPVAGCATGASHEVDIELAARFAIEVAKGFGAGTTSICDESEFNRMVELYGSAKRLQTLGEG